MHRKQSEEEFRTTMKRYGIWRHKYRDVMTCKFCQRRQWKDAELPDFMIVWQGRAYLVECKQSNAYWNFTDADGEGLREIQRRELDRWEADHNPCFLFISLGSGRAPLERSAWLIPWSEWKAIEAILTRRGQHSLSRQSKRKVGALDLLKPWELAWNRGFWTIPPDHVFRQILGGICEVETPAA
jgi:hypothetical protein